MNIQDLQPETLIKGVSAVTTANKSAEVELIEARMKEKELDAKIAIEKRVADAESLAASWTDEFIIVMVFIPLVVTFGMEMYKGGTSVEAWNALAAIPEFMQQIMLILILVVFGMKSLVIKIVDHYLGKR